MRALLPALALAFAILLSACGETRQPPGRVLMVGLDGLDAGMFEELSGRGELPTLTALIAEGARGRLRGEVPALSPRIWTAVATGERPARHGIDGWVHQDATGRMRIFESIQRRVPALWNIVSAAGLEVVTVNWLMTYPPERVSGVVVTDHALPLEHVGRLRFGRRLARASTGRKVDVVGTRDAPLVYPAEWEDRVRELIEMEEPLSDRDRYADNAELAELPGSPQLSRFYWNDQRAARIALELDRELSPDLLMVLLQGIDRFSHFLWGTRSQETAGGLPEHVRVAGLAALEQIYRNSDALVGELLAQRSPDDLVIVVSDHGFELDAQKPGRAWHGTHNTPATRDGVLFMRGAGVPAGGSIGVVDMVEVAPTVLAWLGLPVAKASSGRPIPSVAYASSIRWVDDFSAVPVERIGAGGSEAEAQLLDELKALGYVDGD